jgi:hypothetical protein
MTLITTYQLIFGIVCFVIGLIGVSKRKDLLLKYGKEIKQTENNLALSSLPLEATEENPIWNKYVHAGQMIFYGFLLGSLIIGIYIYQQFAK